MFVQAQEDDACADLLTPRLIPDLSGRVLPGDANRLRESPSLDAETVGFIPGEAEFVVYRGPTCADGFYWWSVGFQTEEGRLQTGWTAEAGDDYWVEPLYIPASRAVSNYRGVSLNYDSRRVWNLGFETEGYDTINSDDYIAFRLDGWDGSTVAEPHIRVFSLSAYVDYASPDADSAITALRDILENEQFPDDLENLVNLPLVSSHQPQQVLPQFLDFQNGTGVRYLKNYIRNSPTYVYLGITDDNEWLVTAELPLSIDILKQFPFNSDEDNLEDYIIEIEANIEDASIEAFDPVLPTIDWMMESLFIAPEPVAPTLDIMPEDVTYTLPSDVAENLNGEYLDSEPFADFTGETAPPVLFFDFDESTAYRQILVYPVALTEQLNIRDFDALRDALENRSDPVPIVFGPRINAGMPLDTRAEYIDFENGSGIRYIAHITQDFTFVNPLYIFTGLTDDGLYYVEVVYNLFLVDLNTAPEMQTYLNNGLNADNISEYYDDAEAIIINADSANFSPSLDDLDAFIRSLSVGD